MKEFSIPPIEMPVDFFIDKAEEEAELLILNKLLKNYVTHCINSEILKKEILKVKGQEISDLSIIDIDDEDENDRRLILNTNDRNTIVLFPKIPENIFEVDYESLYEAEIKSAFLNEDDSVIIEFESKEGKINVKTNGLLLHTPPIVK